MVFRKVLLFTHSMFVAYNLKKNSMSKLPLGTTRKTGETCPESGVWEAQSSPSTTIPLAKGNQFPPYGGKSVTWKLIRYA